MKKNTMLRSIAKHLLDSTTETYSEGGVGIRCGYISGVRSLPKALSKSNEAKPRDKK